jgi:hypothetical protein
MTYSENKIAKEFFLEFTTGAKVSREIYPLSFEKSKLPKRKNVGIVSNFFKKWYEKGYMDSKRVSINKISKKGKKFQSEITVYRLNLNFFYDYADKELGEEKFTKQEKRFLNLIFSYPETRMLVCGYSSLIEGITSFLERIIIQGDPYHSEKLGDQFLKIFFFEKKEYNSKEGIYLQSMEFMNNLTEKIKIISKFEEYDLLWANEKIQNYSSFPLDVLD